MGNVFDCDSTRVYDNNNRITGWKQRCEIGNEILNKNQIPTIKMNKSLFDIDGIPIFILNTDGTITESPLAESEKINLKSVKKVRFEKYYSLEEKLRLLELGITDKNNAEFKEYQRRKDELI